MDDTFASPMPSELVCLALRMGAGSERLAVMASELPAAFAAVGGYSGPTPDCAEQLKAVARMHQFDADRLEQVVAAQDQAMRCVFAATLKVIDELRVARSFLGKGGLEAANFIDHAVSGVADIQSKICTLFPGEAFPST